MNPDTILKRGLRAALRRRYAYAALRTLRRAMRTAKRAHATRQSDPRPYGIKLDDIRLVYFFALKRLERRYGHLPFNDPRAQP